MEKELILDSLVYQYQKIIERKLRKHYDGRMVVMFHQVNDDITKWYDDRYSITFEGFKSFIELVQDAGYEFVDPCYVIRADNKKKVLLTFDDVFEEVYNIVYPFLKQRKIPFAIFPSIDNIDKAGYMNKNMLLEIAREYPECYIGSHGKTHCSMKKCKRSSCYDEIVGAGIKLEKILDKPVLIMAFPFGNLANVGRREQEMAKEKYILAFGTLQAGITTDINNFYIPRLNINEHNYNSIIYMVEKGKFRWKKI